MGVEQRNATRNQSTADYSHKQIFLFDNRYQDGVLANSGNLSEIPAGSLLKRVASNKLEIVSVADSLDPAVVETIVGVLTEDVSGQDVQVSFGVKGTVNSGYLLVKGTTDFQTASIDSALSSGTLTLRDYLERLGFHLESSVEHTKFDN